ncbi:MAG: aldo/keto reductase [Phenylobacterium sp.]|uniref:aldo/keto reductase n=2 Tax=Phenylobacterium sp. TaxID=1871053 RepID=UPI002A308AA0|nr:aldo/keto reductase [Phenylobacterium sp.]MDD3837391.1 aldo/keto reductase [Phenylobacterium sp.]MDX9997600.1 aldo/keto reductase [Phenylobacterium sp.]
MSPTRRQAMLGAAALPLAACSAEPVAATTPPPREEIRPLLTRAISSTGEQIPVIGLGTWQAFDIAPSDPTWVEARAALKTFFDGGGRVVDSSPMYGRAEAAIGALAAELDIAEPLFLATKVWTPGREQGLAQMEQSFERLQVETLDLMQVHNLLDLETHLATLAEWKAAGRVRLIGVTHYNEGAYEALEAAMRRHPLDFVQINYSVAETASERRILPLAQERGMAVLVNRPFAGGDVFARVRRLPLPDWAAEIRAASWAQLLLKFVLAHPAVTCAIPGTRNPRHVADNLGAGAGSLPDAALRRRIVEAVRAA